MDFVRALPPSLTFIDGLNFPPLLNFGAEMPIGLTRGIGIVPCDFLSTLPQHLTTLAIGNFSKRSSPLSEQLGPFVTKLTLHKPPSYILKGLPPIVKTLTLVGPRYQGQRSIRRLPHGLTSLTVRNYYFGNGDFMTHFPSSLVHLDLCCDDGDEDNSFSVSAGSSVCLPRSLVFLRIELIDFDEIPKESHYKWFLGLPASLETFYIRTNSVEGVSFEMADAMSTQCPKLTSFSFSTREFEGNNMLREFIRGLPRSLTTLEISESGTDDNSTGLVPEDLLLLPPHITRLQLPWNTEISENVKEYLPKRLLHLSLDWQQPDWWD
jgi:hypothetical protein